MSEPIDTEFRAAMNAIAMLLDKFFNGDAKGKERTVGFALLTFNFGDAPKVNYIGNVDQEGMIASMKALIARLEGRAPDEVGHA